VKALAARLLAAPPALTLLRARALRGRPLTVLCYHTLGPDAGGVAGWTLRRCADFRADLAYLARHYAVVSLDQGLGPDPGQGKPRAVITFDDGDRGLAEHLPAILDESGLPVTVYVATGQIETGRPFWFDRVVNALQGAGPVAVPELGAWRLPGGGGAAHWAVLRQVLAALKAAPPEDRERLAEAAAQCGVPAGPGLGPMSVAALKGLAARPGVTIAAHSHGHELMDQIPPGAARASALRSRALLRDWTGQEVRHFAFPNGNHNPALRAMLREAGFASAAVLEDRLAPSGCDPFALPRVSVGRYDSPARVRLRLAGL